MRIRGCHAWQVCQLLFLRIVTSAEQAFMRVYGDLSRCHDSIVKFGQVECFSVEKPLTTSPTET